MGNMKTTTRLDPPPTYGNTSEDEAAEDDEPSTSSIREGIDVQVY